MRTVALGLAVSALFFAFGCAHERGDMAGVAQTTSALSTTTSSTSLNVPGGCSMKLPHALEFGEGSPSLTIDERIEVQSWANCLNRPEMRDSTILLLGAADARDESLFHRRAADVREELVRRGVERSRIMIGSPNAAREGGRLGPSNAVLLEVSGSSTLREVSGAR